MPESNLLTMSDYAQIGGTLVATFLGAWFGYLAAGMQERNRDAKLHTALRGALLAEIGVCVDRANTYINENILAPAYRLPTTVYDGVFSQLLSTGAMPAQDVKAVLDFYSQVQQANWLFDEIHGHVKAGEGTGLESRAMKERGRLIAKLSEMNAPGTRFYDPVMRALAGPGTQAPG